MTESDVVLPGIRLKQSEKIAPMRSIARTVLITFLIVHWIVGSADVRGSADDFEPAFQALREGRVHEAIESWSRVIARHPQSYAAYVNRGSAYMRAGHILKGVTDWHKARDLAPFFAYATYTGDFTRQASGNTAVLNYAVSLELEPDHVASVVMTGAAYLDLGRTEEAVELFRKSMDLTKNPLLKNHFDHWAKTLEARARE